jgi:hypothetical protein
VLIRTPFLTFGRGRVIVRARTWSARREAPAHVFFADGRIDNDEAEAFIRGKLASRYRIEQIAYDERFFEDQARRLSDGGFLVTPMTPLGGADPESLGPLPRARSLGWGDRPRRRPAVLSAHVAAAAGTMTDRGWRVSKLKQTSPIDALAAVVLAAYFAAQNGSSVYETREMILV